MMKTILERQRPAAPSRAAVASGHPAVTAAAVEVLRGGGNAFDAIIAAGVAATVAEPALTSLGGGGFLLSRTAAGATTVFDFFVDTPGRGIEHPEEPHFEAVTVNFPGSTQVFNTGLGAAAVPGNLAGFLHVQRRLGQAPLEAVLAPGRRLAAAGVVLNARQAYFLKLLTPILTLTPRPQALFAPHGRLLGAGERFQNPEFAEFLCALARPGDLGERFYRGELAQRIGADMGAPGAGGLLSADDLAAYRVIERQPLALGYRGHTLLSNPPPSFGGTLIGLSLTLLEAAGELPTFGSAAHLATLATALTETTALRERYLRGALDKGLLAASERLARDAAAGRGRLFSRGTTHVSVCDAAGNCAAMTTSNGEGSGYIVPGTGIMLNNMMGEDDLHPDGFHAAPAGQRVGSMMSPSLLLRDQTVELVLGSGGSKRIRSAILQTVSNRVDHRMDLSTAVAAPRLHWEDDTLHVEPGFDDAALAPLETRWPVKRWDEPNMYFGGVHAIAPGAGVAVSAAGDPRRDGCAVVLDER